MTNGSLILVIDDDESIREFLDWALSAEGYEVATATTGADALEFLHDRTPDLILLDLRMPVMDGWTFAEAYRAHLEPHAPIVVMTAARDGHGAVAEIGAAGFIGKPFDLDNLLALVERHTAARQ